MLNTKEEVIEAAKVMQGYAEGKTIQVWSSTINAWADLDCSAISWNWDLYKYRIKPEPEYRPYNSVDEFIEASYMHGQYLMKTDGTLYVPVQINKGGVTIVYGNGEYSYKYDRILKEFLWKDGSRCGKLVNG